MGKFSVKTFADDVKENVLTFETVEQDRDQRRPCRQQRPLSGFELQLLLTTCGRSHQSIRRTRRRIMMNTVMILMDLKERRRDLLIRTFYLLLLVIKLS